MSHHHTLAITAHEPQPHMNHRTPQKTLHTLFWAYDMSHNLRMSHNPHMSHNTNMSNSTPLK